MAGYLIAEEGPLAGLVIRMDEGTEWVLGRDPDEVRFVLEDPMVSRKHVICRLTPEGYVLENLSAVNPATQNGKIIAEPILLREGDIIQVGNTFFRFTEHAPSSEVESPPQTPAFFEEEPSLSFTALPDTRWILKVISGPNSGAEFHLQKGSSYVAGKDASTCDVVFQDLSVSRQHAKISVDEEENVFIEDLGSRNGTLVNGMPTPEKYKLSSQDLVALGTTSFLVIDRKQAFETIVSEPVAPPKKTADTETEEAVAKTPKDWKEMIIPKRHLILAGVFGFLILIFVMGMMSLFQSEPMAKPEKHEGERVAEVIKGYPDVQFSYNEGAGKLFIVGHVLTGIEKQELVYILRGLPFIRDIDDNVVIDEYVWQNMNALLTTNPGWQGISIHSPAPGKFVMRGYLQSAEQAQALSDYINVNFPYLDRLENQVVVENNLLIEIQSKLLEDGFNNVTFQLTDGELVLAGRVDGRESSKFDELVKNFKGAMGIRSLKNFVIYTTEDSSLVDLTSKYKVLGYSKKDGESSYVVINGKILSLGDTLDGMLITAIQPTLVLLEKDGLKFKINYNLQ